MDQISLTPVFLAGNPTWPNPALNIPEEQKRIMKILNDLNEKLKKQSSIEIQFKPSLLFTNPIELQKLPNQLKTSDGIILFHITSSGRSVLKVLEIAKRKKIPVVWFAQPFSGHQWSQYSNYLNRKLNVELIASSNYEDLLSRFRVLNVIAKLRKTKLLVIDNFNHKRNIFSRFKKRKGIHNKFGIEIKYISPAKLEAEFDQIERQNAIKIVKQWKEDALKIVEPSEEELVKSAKLYLAMNSLLEQNQAQAITVACLPLFYRKKLPAYPCLGFSALNDRGLVGVCEADVNAAISQIIGQYLSNKPGFISDPVFDTAKSEIIHAHCVSATKMAGFDSIPEKFVIRSHMEDNKGAALQVFMNPGEIITSLKLVKLSQILVSTGEVIDNIDSEIQPRGCRTKFRTKVTNIEKMLEHYGGGLHRVIFYGDFTQELKIFCHLAGLEYIREDE